MCWMYVCYGKYAGVVIDVLYDYIFVFYWEEFGLG